MTHVHFIGIGGTGLSAIALLLLESGYAVSGSDRAVSPLSRDLASANVQVIIGHKAENILGADIVVRSSAIPDDNPEVAAAKAAGIPVLKRSEFLGQFIADRLGIAVAGTHGKTTTTAMIAWILVRLGQDPSYIIGGVSKNLNGNAHAGLGQSFVIEADEYDRMFLGLPSTIIVITTMEHDHPDCFPTAADYRQAFIDFIHRLKPGGSLLVCRDDPGAFNLSEQRPQGSSVFTYGLEPSSDYQARNLRRNTHGAFTFDAFFQPWDTKADGLGVVELQVPGEHNVRNALAALAVAHRLGLNCVQAARALAEYSGTGRRFDIIGEAGGITIIDDYAHHPTEIKTTLAAARTRFPESRIWAVWQPHTYSRTQSLLDSFAASFSNADIVLVTEIYAAREQNKGFSAVRVVEKMKHPHTRFVVELNDAIRILIDELRPGDVLLVLSAGDADAVSAQVLADLKGKEKAHV